MSVISAVKTYLATYTGLKTGAPLWVNHLGAQADGYSIVPLPGEKVLEHWINGGSLRLFPFAFQSKEYTADELERLESAGFYEDLADWFEEQTRLDNLPTLGAGQSALKIEALGWAYLYEQGKSDTGIYQIQCRLTYEQEP